MKYTSTTGAVRVPNRLKDNIVTLALGENLQRVETRNRSGSTVIVGYGHTVPNVTLYDLNTGTDVATEAGATLGTGGAFIIAAEHPFNAISFDVSSASGAHGNVYFGGTTEVDIDDGVTDYQIITPDLTATGEQILFFAHAGETRMDDATLIANGWPEGKYCLVVEIASGTLTADIQVANIVTHANLATNSTFVDDPAAQLPRGTNLVVLQETADTGNTVSATKTR